jgi:hypothetical protein
LIGVIGTIEAQTVKFMKILILCTALFGCTAQVQTPSQFGPDPYQIECRNDQIWIISEHGEVNTEVKCDE